jgi:hypothetical protein
MKRNLFLSVFIFLSVVAYSQTGTSAETETEVEAEAAAERGHILMITPNASVGRYSAVGNDDIKGLSYSYGLKIILPANELQRYGILVEALTLTGEKDTTFLRTGIFLEQVLFRFFNMGIGTVGYVSLSENATHPFGLYSHMGFEYAFTKHVLAAALYQSEWIFDAPILSNNAFMVSVSLRF